MQKIIKQINWKKVNGLVPAIIQNSLDGSILMLGYMNQLALEKTLETKQVWFYSRTKNRLWKKGETSNNVLKVESYSLDCDKDTLLFRVNPAGPTCHTGQDSCFVFKASIISELYSVIEKRKQELPKDSYTTILFEEGIDKINEKIIEEAEEVCLAGKEESQQRVIEESVDVLYHLFVLLNQRDIEWLDVLEEIKQRRS